MTTYYAGKASLVTGAAAGFGFGFSQRLLEEGGRCVWMTDYNAENLHKSASILREAFPGKVFEAVVDASKRDEVVNVIKRADAECDGLDFLFNNAGRPKTKPSDMLAFEDIEELMQLNYMGVMYGTFTALHCMLPRGRGHIINMASCCGLVPAPFQTAYASSKAAVIAMTRCLAYEYHGTGIHFSQIAPMNVATSIFSVEQEFAMRNKGVPEAEIRKAVAEITPPANAIPLAEAVTYIFEKIAEQQVDIVLGEEGREYDRLFRTDRPAFDKIVLDMGEKRRAFYQALARGENPVFPG